MSAVNQSSLWVPVVGVGSAILAAVMVAFMLTQPQMYPLWTIVMMGLIGVVALLYAVNDVRDRLGE